MLKPSVDTSFCEAVNDFWMDLSHEGNYSLATKNVIYNIGLDANPVSWEECDDFIEHVVNMYQKVRTKEGLVQWLESRKDNLDIEGPELWDCGSECKYKDIAELIADTDLDFVVQTINDIWNDVCDESSHK